MAQVQSVTYKSWKWFTGAAKEQPKLTETLVHLQNVTLIGTGIAHAVHQGPDHEDSAPPLLKRLKVRFRYLVDIEPLPMVENLNTEIILFNKNANTDRLIRIRC